MFNKQATLTNHFQNLFLLLAMLSMWVMLPGCSRRESASGDEKKIEPISQTEPKFTPFPRTAPALVNLRPVASKGDCAPKYAIGLHGTCINNVACRGFGVVGENGQPVCACFAKAGGCDQGDRCDIIKKTCVSEKEPGFGRIPDD